MAVSGAVHAAAGWARGWDGGWPGDPAARRGAAPGTGAEAHYKGAICLEVHG